MPLHARLAAAKTTDLILIILDATKSEEQRWLLKLDAVGIRLNKCKPDVVFKWWTTGGITLNTTIKLTKTDEKTICTILAGYTDKLHNCDVMIREDLDTRSGSEGPEDDTMTKANSDYEDNAASKKRKAKSEDEEMPEMLADAAKRASSAKCLHDGAQDDPKELPKARPEVEPKEPPKAHLEAEPKSPVCAASGEAPSTEVANSLPPQSLAPSSPSPMRRQPSRMLTDHVAPAVPTASGSVGIQQEGSLATESMMRPYDTSLRPGIVQPNARLYGSRQGLRTDPRYPSPQWNDHPHGENHLQGPGRGFPRYPPDYQCNYHNQRMQHAPLPPHSQPSCVLQPPHGPLGPQHYDESYHHNSGYTETPFSDPRDRHIERLQNLSAITLANIPPTYGDAQIGLNVEARQDVYQDGGLTLRNETLHGLTDRGNIFEVLPRSVPNNDNLFVSYLSTAVMVYNLVVNYSQLSRQPNRTPVSTNITSSMSFNLCIVRVQQAPKALMFANQIIQTGIATIIVLEYSAFLPNDLEDLERIKSAVDYYMKSPTAVAVEKGAKEIYRQGYDREEMGKKILEFILENRLCTSLAWL
ncbi:uncharacterized protein F5147DRAFT_657739 [Suillus discolor]|uniref:Uncharacterized protein n=1 Tax=Suillus discolor TaxID=1912936 RepID=A0A9P7EUN1_9AGAM|nr:uncharacterized protein F5147DRAFT_657739 [Suillus discolor]KAG2092113.1 hypothetical protein F5147DRAFT_657739 [Suillus discolor]